MIDEESGRSLREKTKELYGRYKELCLRLNEVEVKVTPQLEIAHDKYNEQWDAYISANAPNKEPLKAKMRGAFYHWMDLSNEIYFVRKERNELREQYQESLKRYQSWFDGLSKSDQFSWKSKIGAKNT